MIGPFRGKYFFLSNFYPTDPYPVEMLYQASKTLDPSWKEWILKASTPGIAKRRGRSSPARIDWEDIKLQTMEDLVTQKFFSHPELADKLMDTGDEELVEVNWWGDVYWGRNRAGVGENHLGKIHMKIRQELRDLKE